MSSTSEGHQSVPDIVGQISLNDEVGRWIRLLASLRQVQNICEVGTWWGGGSTECIRSGLLDRPELDGSCISIEIDGVRARHAALRFQDEPRIKVVHGRVVDARQFDRRRLSQQEREWLLQDELAASTAPDVTNLLPSKINLLILDGGEFSTFAEFMKLLKLRPDFVILDDTRARKSRRVASLIRRGRTGLRVIHESSERHGTLVAGTRRSQSWRMR